VTERSRTGADRLAFGLSLDRRAVRVCWWLLVALLIAYSATTVPGVRSHPGYSTLIDGWVQNALLVAASLFILARAWMVRFNRLGWFAIGVGLGLYAAGSIAYFSYVQYQDSPPVPSAADVMWLASYAFLFVGVGSVIRRRLVMSDRTLVLDATIAVLGLTAVASTWLSYLLHVTQGRFAEVAVTMSYPLCDLVLLTMIVGACAMLRLRSELPLVYLAVGLLLFAGADTVYTLRIAAGTYEAGTLLDPMWAVAAVLMVRAALGSPAPAPAEAMRPRDWSALIVPLAFTTMSLGLLLYGEFRRLPIEATVLGATAMLAAMVRGALSYRDVQRLALSKVEARTDELTGLGNRRRFHEVVSARIENGDRLAVLMLDLDRFKEINDSLGHSMGDNLLVDVGQRLLEHMRRDDLLVRLGGDEFAVLLHDTGAKTALAVAERLRRDLQRGFVVGDITTHIDVSIGVALHPDTAATVEGLMQRADIAMYEAKADRLGAQVYCAKNHDDPADRLRLAADLRGALNNDDLVLHYQPKVALDTQRVVGVEALVRWAHPERGLLYPDRFLPDAERYGLMRRLTTTVLAKGLEQAAVWYAEGMPLSVAVNVSAADLLDTELPSQIADMLAIRGLPGDALVIEVTETTLLVNPERAFTTLQRLRELGVRVSIDDYGTGYSSLARLRELPVDELKLDRSFVADLHQDARASAIVESTIRLAHSLNLTIVAEGVEDSQTQRLLESLGCDVGQGYHFGRPAPAQDLAPNRVSAGNRQHRA